MHRQLVTFVLLTVGLCGAAHADLYVAGKVGPALVDVRGVDDDPLNAGFTLGYQVSIVAVEGEVTRTIEEGDAGGARVEVDSNAVYVGVVTPGPVYFKGRVGLRDTTVRVGGAEDSESGGSLGLGMGFSLGLLRLEFEATSLSDDVIFLSAGLVF